MTKQSSCADPSEPDAITVEEARKQIFAQTKPLQGTQKLALRSALNHFLAEDICSPVDVPSHINSAMDGYAIAGKDLPQDTPQSYQVLGTSYAGAPCTDHYQPGGVIRIMTGGVMPAGTDTVIMQEMVELIDSSTDKPRISIKPGHKAGQNVRQAGEDIAKNSSILSAGRQLTPADLGILASLGVAECRVFRRPRVAFFSTGDELRSIGEPLAEGEIYDSNRYTLYAMLKQLGVDILDMGVIRDTEDDIREAFMSASKMADVIITSGGVSVGEADYIKPTLKALGDTHFWKISMKPGRPLTFGKLGNALFFGLPGNPVAVMVTFMQFVQPAIHYLASGQIKMPLNLLASCSSKLYKRPGRSEFQRGIFEHTADGKIMVKRTGKQGSGILTSMSLANCFILLPEESSGVEPGDSVLIQPFINTV